MTGPKLNQNSLFEITNRHIEIDQAKSDLKVDRVKEPWAKVSGLKNAILECETEEEVHHLVNLYFNQKQSNSLYKIDEKDKRSLRAACIRNFKQFQIRNLRAEITPLQINAKNELQTRKDIYTELLTSTLAICLLRAEKGRTDSLFQQFTDNDIPYIVESTAHPKLGCLTVNDFEVLYALMTIAKQNTQNNIMPIVLRFNGRQLLQGLGRPTGGGSYKALSESLDRLQDCRIDISEYISEKQIKTRLNFRFLDPNFKFSDSSSPSNNEYVVRFSRSFLDQIDGERANNIWKISHVWMNHTPPIIKRVWQYLNLKKRPGYTHSMKESSWIAFLQARGEPRNIRKSVNDFVKTHPEYFPYRFSFYKNKSRECIWVFDDLLDQNEDLILDEI